MKGFARALENEGHTAPTFCKHCWISYIMALAYVLRGIPTSINSEEFYTYKWDEKSVTPKDETIRILTAWMRRHEDTLVLGLKSVCLYFNLRHAVKIGQLVVSHHHHEHCSRKTLLTYYACNTEILGSQLLIIMVYNFPTNIRIMASSLFLFLKINWKQINQIIEEAYFANEWQRKPKLIK